MISFLLTLRLTLSERKNTITDVGSTATYSKMDGWTGAYLDIKSNKTNNDDNDIDDDSGAEALNVIQCECCDTVSKGILTKKAPIEGNQDDDNHCFFLKIVVF